MAPLEFISWIFFIAIALLVFFPRYGFIARMMQEKKRAERIRIEDALKHIYDCEYKGRPCTVKSLAGSVQISQNQTADLIQRLQDGRLATITDDVLHLTDEGREYALRVIRSHRLWERFLADETNIKETDWHSEAERMEHSLSDEDVNKLAARLGHPRFDPHGDPIPTELGNQPLTEGTSLTVLAEGDKAQIIHIEDEPESTYAELVRYGFRPGLNLLVVEKQQSEIIVDVNGLNITLTHIQAGNLTVVPVEERVVQEVPEETLADVQLGATAVVKRILPGCRGQQRRRLMDLGVLPGTEITAEMASPMGDPVAYSIRGATIALRKEQAQMIEVESN